MKDRATLATTPSAVPKIPEVQSPCGIGLRFREHDLLSVDAILATAHAWRVKGLLPTGSASKLDVISPAIQHLLMKKPPEQKKVAEWLKDTREALQMTQREFAAHLAKTAPFANANFVAKMELGERRLDVVEFVKVCRALGTNPQKMFARLLEYIG